MKKILLLTTILATTHLDIFAQQTKQVLFIGNSYTANHDIPSIISNIASSAGNTLLYNAHTPGGAQFAQHATNATVDALIRRGGWDAVVLQEQSQLPSFRPADVRVMVYPYATQLVDKVRAVDSCTEVIFYNTWGRQRGDTQNCSYYPNVCTYEGMDDELFTNYEAMARDNEATLSPVGRVWRYLNVNYPNLNLYENDESHQNRVGAYAIALTFNTILFGTKPADVTYTHGLSSNDLFAVKEAVSNVVYDNLSLWSQFQLIKNAVADFQYTNANNVYQFNAVDSSSRQSYKWFINDSLVNANGHSLTHTFDTAGTYKVCLEVTNTCKSTINCVDITVAPNNTSAKTLHNTAIQVYPNPTTGVLNIKTDVAIEKVYVYDVYGNVLMHATSNTIDISTLNTGMYIIKVQDVNGEIGVNQIIKN